MGIQFGKTRLMNKPKGELKTQIILPLFTHKIMSMFLTVFHDINKIIYTKFLLSTCCL